MRAGALCLLVVLAIFASPSRSGAASIDITLTHVPLTTTWTLRLNSVNPTYLGAIGFFVSDSLVSFTPTHPFVDYFPPTICPAPGCDVPGYILFFAYLNPPIPPLSDNVLGFFTAASPDSIVSVLPGDHLLDGTVFDPEFTAIPDFALYVVPEPGVSGLLLVGLLGVLALRGRA